MSSSEPYNTIFPWPQSRDLHIVAIVPASLTLISTILGTFWFWSMQRKNFRQVLILMLILADGSKGLWILIFNIIGLRTSSKIHSNSVFCQVGGFCLQYSFEACDLAVLLLTIHVSSQILLPSYTPLGREGLYCVRRWVLAIFVLLPAIDAAIPFIRYPHNVAYSYDGAYCSLFTGPLWFNLSLSWLPRYLIWLCVLFVLASLYIYIRSQSFARKMAARETNLGPKQLPKRSAAVFLSCFRTARRRLSFSETAEPKPAATIPDETNIAPWLTLSNDEVQPLQPVNVDNRSPSKQAQRLMLYPLVYIMAWSVPFSAQCISYSRTHSVNSIFALRAASIFCVALLGVLDVLVFSWREKPWQYTAHGDGTLWGSLTLIRHMDTPFPSRRSSVEQSTQPLDGTTPIQVPAKTLRSHGRGSDHDRRLAQLAFDRLALEQADALAQTKASRNQADQQFTLLPDVSGESV